MYYCKSDDLIVTIGSERTLLFQVVQSNSEPVGLSGATIKARIQRKYQDSSPIIDWDVCVITDADEGYCTLDIESAETSTWEDGGYILQLVIESSTETSYTYPNDFYVKPRLEDAP